MVKRKSNKRHRAKDEEFEQLLLKKLKQKYKKKKSRRRMSSSSSSSSSDSFSSSDSRSSSDVSILSMHSEESDNATANGKALTQTNAASQNNAPAEVLAASADLQQSTSDKTEVAEPEKTLNDKFQPAIGKRLTEERILAPNIHSDLAIIWKDIIKIGLPTKDKADLIKKYPPPQNCTFVDPPKLNKEVYLAMTNFARARDKRVVSKHEKLAACLAALAKTIAVLTERNSYADVPMVEWLGDLGRLLTDTIHDETAIRRSLIIANFNSIKDTLTKAESGEYLFGTNLSENLKAAKIVAKSAEDLKGSSTKKSQSEKPRYNCTWDPQIVLNYFRLQCSTEEMTLEEQSLKLITLLAIVTGHRMQTYSLIKIEDITRYDTKVVINITGCIKTTRKNFKQPMLVLPFYEEKKICPAFTLITYMNTTKHIRGSTTKLFISTKKPFKGVTAQTLSRWIKETLNDSGIDTSIFSSHSTRHASTSTANRLSININQIRETAGWSKNYEDFARFYGRDITRRKIDIKN